MRKPSFMSSTLSMLTVISVFAIIGFQVFGIEVSDFTNITLSGIIGAYIGARMPNSKKEEEKEDELLEAIEEIGA